MVKVKILKEFTETNDFTKRYKAGSTAEFAGDRVEKIQKALPGFIEVIEKPSGDGGNQGGQGNQGGNNRGGNRE